MYGEKGILMIALWCSTFSSHGAKAQKPYYTCTCSYYFDYLHFKASCRTLSIYFRKSSSSSFYTSYKQLSSCWSVELDLLRATPIN